MTEITSRLSTVLAAAAAVVTCAVIPAQAQSSDEPAVPEKEGKVLQAFRVRGDTPEIDGRLDDAVWAQADSIDGLIQNEFMVKLNYWLDL